MMAFKRYKGARKGIKVDTPAITISKTGRMNINAATTQHFEGYGYANLFYDETTNRIGVQPAQERQEGTMKIIGRGKSRGFWIAADGFYKVNNIQYEVTTAYSAAWDNEEEMLIASLDKPIK